MRILLLSTSLALCALLAGYGLGSIHQINKSPKFYDGEGNLIPVPVVQLLVKSQFVYMDKAERDSLRKIFLRH
jgi:hypothetical protein